MRQAYQRYVTGSFKEVQFNKPVYVGDVLSMYSQAKRVGRTSLTIDVRVCARRRSEPDKIVHVTQAEVVFVAVDDAGKPIPVWND